MDAMTIGAALGAAAVGWLFVTTKLGKTSAADAKRHVEDGAALLDVRTREEFARGHLPGARNVPLHTLAAQARALAESHESAVVYCASGVRSAQAARILRSAGMKRVHDLGAMTRWR